VPDLLSRSIGLRAGVSLNLPILLLGFGFRIVNCGNAANLLSICTGSESDVFGVLDSAFMRPPTRKQSRPSIALRRLLTNLRDNVDELAHIELQEVRRRIPEYRAIDDPETLAEVLTNSREGASIMLEMFLAGRPPSKRRLERSANMVRRRVDQKVPLD